MHCFLPVDIFFESLQTERREAEQRCSEILIFVFFFFKIRLKHEILSLWQKNICFLDEIIFTSEEKNLGK